MADLQKIGALEALLFHYGEPVSIKKAGKILKLRENICEEIVEALTKKFNEDSSSAIFLLRKDDEVQLVTKPQFNNVLESLIREEFREELTPATTEALTIVAYLGPISRITLDYIRGVNSSFTLRNLLMRGLIDRKPSLEKRGVYEYGVSLNFLKHMGLGSVQELPEYEKYRTILSQFDIKDIT